MGYKLNGIAFTRFEQGEVITCDLERVNYYFNGMLRATKEIGIVANLTTNKTIYDCIHCGEWWDGDISELKDDLPSIIECLTNELATNKKAEIIEKLLMVLKEIK
jgi:hypothetical protein